MTSTFFSSSGIICGQTIQRADLYFGLAPNAALFVPQASSGDSVFVLSLGPLPAKIQILHGSFPGSEAIDDRVKKFLEGNPLLVSFDGAKTFHQVRRSGGDARFFGAAPGLPEGFTVLLSERNKRHLCDAYVGPFQDDLKQVSWLTEKPLIQMTDQSEIQKILFGATVCLLPQYYETLLHLTDPDGCQWIVLKSTITYGARLFYGKAGDLKDGGELSYNQTLSRNSDDSKECFSSQRGDVELILEHHRDKILQPDNPKTLYRLLRDGRGVDLIETDPTPSLSELGLTDLNAYTPDIEAAFQEVWNRFRALY